MKKILLLLGMTGNLLCMEEKPASHDQEKTVHKPAHIWRILEGPGAPDLKFIAALPSAKLTEEEIIKTTHPEELKDYIRHIKKVMGEKIVDLFNKYGELLRFSKANQQIKELIEAGADVNAQGLNGWTPLLTAVYYPGNEPLVELLLKAGANPNSALTDGTTPLIMSKSKDTAKQLLDAGAHVNAQTSLGMTALLNAVRANDPGRVKLFIDAGADVNAKTAQGQTALMSAVFGQRSWIRLNRIPVEADHFEVIDLLLNAGAHVDPATAALAAGVDEEVRALIQEAVKKQG